MAPVKEGVLWMGGLADYMSEKFLKDAFKSLGEDDVESINIVKNKFTGEVAGYGFIYFDCDASALIAMHKLNGKIIPNSQPPVRFQLNHSSSQAAESNPFAEREYSIWVTDLPENCSDELLTKTFASRFDSIKAAKVMTDLSHGRKPYGFVRFSNQEEQRDALIHMNGFRGMGDKPIKVSMAIPKNKFSKEDELGKKGGGGQYSYYYESYWADKAAWTNYAAYQVFFSLLFVPQLVSFSALTSKLSTICSSNRAVSLIAVTQGMMLSILRKKRIINVISPT